MASANKSTGLQIALVFFVMLTIVLLASTYLQFRQNGDLDGRLKTAADQRQKAESEKQVLQTNLDTLKAFVGYPSTPEIGKPEAEDNASVIGQCKKVIADNAPGELTKPTIVATIQSLGQEVASLQQVKATLQGENLNLNQKVNGLQSTYQQEVDAHRTARERAEKDRNAAQNDKETEVAAKEKESEERQQKIAELRTTLDASIADATKQKETDKNAITKLRDTNNSLRSKREAESNVYYDVPSGKIEWVDRETGLVWINRGDADSLRKGINFSVYKQINKGVARGGQDIKGSIEVTRIIGPHLAEARITKSKISEPIVKGDAIYTPLWKVGQQEHFAFVGLIDLDHDGVSDRDVLHDLVAGANAIISDEVDDQGIRHPTQGSINVGTKFLVVGEIPDFTQSRQQDKEAHEKIGKLHKQMRDEALEHGVRIVSLEDFLSYIGYEAGRRIYRPGVTNQWNLRSGMIGTTARPTGAGRTESMGKNSGIFNERGAKIQQSPGATSKLFKQPQ